jgi:uncharacterized protein (DUF924 family)
MPAHTADEVREFWFSAATQPHWFARSEAFDARLREALGPLHAQAARGELDGWASTPRGALALILLLDQAPRNLHRVLSRPRMALRWGKRPKRAMITRCLSA